jgi:hypothetical protein
MAQPEDLWLSRYAALGRAQSRYLYLLLIVVGFFLIVEYRTRNSPGYACTPVGISGLGLELPPATLLLFGPILISMLLLGVLGSLKAVRHAHGQLDRLLNSKNLSVNESVDPVPNLIDMVVYGLDEAPRLALAVGAASYPLVLSGAFAAAVYLTASTLVAVRTSVAHERIAYGGAVLLVPVAWRLLAFWGTRLKGIARAFKWERH